MLLVTTSVLVLPTRVPKRPTTGRLISSDLFRTTPKVKTQQQVARSRGQHCGDIELAGYLANGAGPVSLLLDPVYERRVGPLAFVFSLSSHRQSYIGLLYSSRFIDL